jgi:hypothetical protein
MLQEKKELLNHKLQIAVEEATKQRNQKSNFLSTMSQ